MIRPHTKITCMLPSGFQLSAPLLFIQAGGTITSDAQVSYNQCPTGRIIVDNNCIYVDNYAGNIACSGQYQEANNILCSNCSLGTTSTPGASTCSLCPINHITFPAEPTACNLCPSNAEANQDRTLCLCSAGFYAVNQTLVQMDIFRHYWQSYQQEFLCEDSSDTSCTEIFDPHLELDMWCVQCPVSAMQSM